MLHSEKPLELSWLLRLQRNNGAFPEGVVPTWSLTPDYMTSPRCSFEDLSLSSPNCTGVVDEAGNQFRNQFGRHSGHQGPPERTWACTVARWLAVERDACWCWCHHPKHDGYQPFRLSFLHRGPSLAGNPSIQCCCLPWVVISTPSARYQRAALEVGRCNWFPQLRRSRHQMYLPLRRRSLSSPLGWLTFQAHYLRWELELDL